VLNFLTGATLFSALRQRLKASVRQLAVTAGLLLLAAFFFALAVLYLVHAFYVWLAPQLGTAIAALVTAGLVSFLGLIILAILSITRGRRRTAAPASPLRQSAGQFGQTLGLAAASRLFARVGRRVPPRLIVLAIGLAATVLAASLVRGRRTDRREE
jgi:hypothetical protein